jgi:hypothetical protein
MDDNIWRLGIPNSFKYLDTYGLPLEIMMDECEKRDTTLALDLFVRDAVNSGWTFDHAISVCMDALMARHGPQIGQQQADRLKMGMMVHYKRYWPSSDID